jgi:carboxymethylenebutenolidase
MGTKLELVARDGGSFSVYRAEPSGPARGVVVVVQEIYGVNHHIRSVADGFARDGYLALAPGLFDRLERDEELAYDAAGAARGGAFPRKLGWDGPLADIQATVEAAAPAGRVAVVGYCWGGSLAFRSAARVHGIACAVGYYGGHIVLQLDQTPRVPLLLHFGEKDAGIPLSDVEKIRQALPAAEIHTYPAAHGFNCDERQSYDALSAALARGRTIDFLRQYLG